MTHTISIPLPWQQVAFTQWIERQHSERPAHASLLIAPEDTGGEQLVEAMAAAMLCESPTPEHYACGTCGSCQLIAAFSHPDYRLLRPSMLDMAHPIEEMRPEKPSKEITIDQVRALDNMVNQTSHRGGKRVVVVYPAHKLNRNAANALLKTLEEPPANTLFILLAHDVQQLIPTIVSRCQLISTGTPSTEAAVAYLNKLESNPRWAEYIQQENGAVMRVANLVKTDYFSIEKNFIEQLARGKNLDAIATATAFEKHIKDADKARLAGAPKTIDMATLITWLQRWAYDLILCAQQGGAPRYYAPYQDAMTKITANTPASFTIQLHAWQAKLTRERRIADHPLNVRSWVEKLLLEYVGLFG